MSRIFIVEDDPDVRMSIADLESRRGMRFENSRRGAKRCASFGRGFAPASCWSIC